MLLHYRSGGTNEDFDYELFQPNFLEHSRILLGCGKKGEVGIRGTQNVISTV